MRLRNVWVYTLGFALAAAMAACGGGEEPSSTSTAPATPAGGAGGGMRVDTATAGTVSGVVNLEGAAPANEPIRMNADPVCVKEAGPNQRQQTFVTGNDGKTLGNVFVYVKDGLDKYTFDTPSEPVKLDQNGCRYAPHVFGIRVGQPLTIVNSDPTLHNIHATPKVNDEFNTGQPIEGMTTNHTFTAKEVMVPFKCDVHGWMNAYAGVLDHPYFAVTGEDGTFELDSLPPGTYTIEAWHERLGPMTQSVTLADKGTQEITFTFKAGGAPTN